MGKISARIGQENEELAAAYLTNCGYTVLGRNFRGGGGELDIIAEKDGVVYFVEVKARRSGSQVTAIEAVTPNKKRRLAAAARAWLYQMRGGEADCSFILITVENTPGGTPKIDLIEDFLLW